MGFSEELRDSAAVEWGRIFATPFVVGIGDGTLPLPRFRFYLQQDYVFLIDYCRVLALAAAKESRLAVMGRLTEVLHATLNTELGLHRSYCSRSGISTEALEATEPAPTTLAYTSHLLAVAHSGTLLDLAAALLPCHWGYWEIGQMLAGRREPADAPLYAEWIRLYSSPEYGALADWLRRLVNELAEEASASERARARREYRTSVRYEYLFWEMAYQESGWPI